MASKVKAGERAPDFQLKAPSGETVRLSDYLGKKNVVLFFYPKDETPGCTVEVCTFRDSYDEFVGAGAEVIGISADSEDSHVRFAKKHQLPMLLLSDPEGVAADAYGVRSLFGLLPGRVTYLIDKQGIVRHVWSSHLRVKDHVHTALEVLRSLGDGPSQVRAT